MHRVRFTATPDRPSWLHRKARVERVPHGDTTTTKVFPAEVLADGDEVEMDAFDKQWCLTYLPKNFSVVTE